MDSSRAVEGHEDLVKEVNDKRTKGQKSFQNNSTSGVFSESTTVPSDSKNLDNYSLCSEFDWSDGNKDCSVADSGPASRDRVKEVRIKADITEENRMGETGTETNKTEGSRMDETRAEENETAGSRTDETRTVAYKTEESKTDETRAEENKTAGSRTDETKTVAYKTEESKTDETRAEENKTAGSRTDETRAEENKTAGSRTDETRTEENRAKLNGTMYLGNHDSERIEGRDKQGSRVESSMPDDMLSVEESEEGRSFHSELCTGISPITASGDHGSQSILVTGIGSPIKKLTCILR